MWLIKCHNSDGEDEKESIPNNIIDTLKLEDMTEEDKKRHDLVNKLLHDFENDIDPEGWEDITSEIIKTIPGQGSEING